MPVALLATRQRSGGESRAAMGSVLRRHEARELLIGGQHLVIDCFRNLAGKALLVGSGNAAGVFLCRLQKRIIRDDSLALGGNLLQQKANGHEVVFHACAQNLFGLREHARNLMQARNVILVVLDAAERRGEREIGQISVRAAHLRERHFKILKGVVFVATLQHTNHQLVGKEILVAKTFGRKCLEASKELLIREMLALGLSHRYVIELVVVAIVPVRGRSFRRGLQVRLILLLKQRVLRGEARSDGVDRSRESGRSEKQGNGKTDNLSAHLELKTSRGSELSPVTLPELVH